MLLITIQCNICNNKESSHFFFNNFFDYFED